MRRQFENWEQGGSEKVEGNVLDLLGGFLLGRVSGLVIDYSSRRDDNGRTVLTAQVVTSRRRMGKLVNE